MRKFIGIVDKHFLINIFYLTVETYKFIADLFVEEKLFVIKI